MRTEKGKANSVDALDLSILEKLLGNGRITFKELAKVTRSDQRTIASRYQRLVNLGIIEAVEVRNIGSLEAGSVEDYLTMLLEGTPIGHSLSEETQEVQKAVRAKTKSNIARYATAEGVSIPAECVVMVASKPV